MKLKKVLSGLMAAVIAVTASVCATSVSAGAITKKITYIGHDYDLEYIPPLFVYNNAEYGKFISSDGYEDNSIIEIESSKADTRLMEYIEPTDIITFSIVAENGKEEALDVRFGTCDYKSPVLTSYSGLNDNGVFGTKGVLHSGLSVQEMIDQYNKDLSDMKYLNEFKDVKDLTINNISAIYVYQDVTKIKDYGNFTWKITVEPGNKNGNKSLKKLSDAQFTTIKNQTYTGKAIKPSITIKDGNKKLVSGTDYTVTYKNNTKPGKATVTITGKGNYTGTKTITFNIVPKKVRVSAKTSDTDAVLSWKKSTGAAGYEIYYSTDGGKFRKLTTVKGTKYSAEMTAAGTYKFKVRPYVRINGKKVYGQWSNTVSCK